MPEPGELPTPPPATLPGAPDLLTDAEPEAWAAVRGAWQDEAVHRAYLARFTSLPGLALAGGRYRAVLQERPTDAMALRIRDEIVKRATVQGLATLPRTAPPTEQPRIAKRLMLFSALAFASAAAWAAYRLFVLLGARL